tara:strand:+ start:307 stop:552 length:246 start_codon:yes stop_codon:yes gene_type:complete
VPASPERCHLSEEGEGGKGALGARSDAHERLLAAIAHAEEQQTVTLLALEGSRGERREQRHRAAELVSGEGDALGVQGCTV